MQDENLNEKLIKLAEEGNKIGAIRLYYETTGVGLKDAIEYINRLLAEIPESSSGKEKGGLNKDVLLQIHRHLRIGSKVKALKLYVEATGAEISDGKQYVDNLYNELELGKKEEKKEAELAIKPVSVEYEEVQPVPEVEEITREIEAPEERPMQQYIPIEKERKQFSRYQRGGRTPFFLFVVIAVLVALFVLLLLLLNK
ncbi:MAG: hypothetical protein E6772_08190 [Dysgonomonas sp.]|nr:hypothetical protein [Dysgonomonas sp.]